MCRKIVIFKNYTGLKSSCSNAAVEILSIKVSIFSSQIENPPTDRWRGDRLVPSRRHRSDKQII